KKPRVFFFPDQHLGRNTAHAMGVPLDHMAEWDFRAEDLDGVNRACFRPETRIILWRGFCSVHTKFTKRQIDEARAEDPAVKVLVHPECPVDVGQNADVAGSRESISEQGRSAPPRAPRGQGLRVSAELPIANGGSTPAAPESSEHPAHPELRVYGAPRPAIPQRLPVTPRTRGCASGAGVGVGAVGSGIGGFRRLPD